MRQGGAGELAGRRLARGVFTVAVIAASSAACAGPSADASLCSGATITAMETISTRLAEDGTLRHGRTLEAAPDSHFVSAELLPEGEDEDHDGDILTWFTTDPAGDRFESVDVNAREQSDWPAAGFDVRADGAIESRGCVLRVRGKPPAGDCQPGLEQFC